MTFDPNHLPDDPAQLKSIVVALLKSDAARQKTLDEMAAEMSRLNLRIEQLLEMIFGKKSEKRPKPKEEYGSDSIRDLYRGRWQVEADLRTIKSFMSMEVLRGNTPDMVEREFWMGLLAYNLVRVKMLQTEIAARRKAREEEIMMKNVAAKKMETKKTKNKIEAKDLTARNMSFSVALTSIAVSYVTLHFMSAEQRRINRQQGKRNRAGVQVGNRPDRFEPRCLKRRVKSQRLMQEPRDELRVALCRGESPTQNGDEAAAQLGEA